MFLTPPPFKDISEGNALQAAQTDNQTEGDTHHRISHATPHQDTLPRGWNVVPFVKGTIVTIAPEQIQDIADPRRNHVAASRQHPARGRIGSAIGSGK